MIRTLLVTLVAISAVLISPVRSFAQDDAAKDLKARIEQTREMMEKARRDGNWEDFINLQKKLADLHTQLENAGEKAGGEGDDWTANLKKRLAGMDEAKRIEALERLAAELKERGEHDRAKLVADLLKRHLDGKKGDDPGKAMKEIEKAIKKGRKAIEAAEEDFDFDKADALRADLAKLEAKKTALAAEMTKSGRGQEMNREARLKQLFEDLMRAGREGDKDLVERIKREIQEIKRGGEASPADWKAEAHAVIEKTIGQFKEWAQNAVKEGNQEDAADLQDAVSDLKDLWEAIDRAKTPEERLEISKQLLDAIEELADDAVGLRESGKEGKAKMTAWASEQMKKVHGVIVSGGKPAQPVHGKAAAIIAEVAEKMENWARDAKESGDSAKSEKLANDARNIRRFADALRSGPSPEIMDKLAAGLNEGAEKVRREIEAARDAGEEDKARMLEWVLDRMRQARETLGAGLHPERGGEQWRTECTALVDEVAGRLDELLEQARRTGGERAVSEIGKALRGVVEFRDALKFAGPPEIGSHLVPLVEKGLDQIEKNIQKARDGGDQSTVEFLEWTAGKLRLTQEILRNATGPGREGPDQGLRDKFRKAREEIAKMIAEAGELEAAGKADMAEALRRKAEDMRRRVMDEMREAGGPGRRGQGGDERGPQAGPGRRGPGGGEERGQFGRRMRGLMEEMRKAEEQGDKARMEELRAKMEDLKREMEGGRPEQPDARPEAGPDPEQPKVDREAEKLRKEIDSLRKELQELKKLLKELLKEKE